jgi:hypothetical protein
MFVGFPRGTRDWRLVPADIAATRLSHAALPVWFRPPAAEFAADIDKQRLGAAENARVLGLKAAQPQ